MGDGAGFRVIEEVKAGNRWTLIGEHIMEDLVHATPLMVKGLGAMIGIWVFGPNGPFLFHRFGLGTPAAVTLGVFLGAGLGYLIGEKVWTMRHRRLTMRHAPYDMTIDPHLGAGLRI
jgi:hypothetical protein